MFLKQNLDLIHLGYTLQEEFLMCHAINFFNILKETMNEHKYIIQEMNPFLNNLVKNM